LKTHAYLIVAHNEPKALRLLVSILDDARNHIYIHIDEKSKHLFVKEEIISICSFSKVTFIPSIKVYWSGYSQIQVTLNLLHTAIANKHRYYHLVSGVDLPLKSQDELHLFFQENDGDEFVSGTKVTTWKTSTRFKYYHYEKLVAVIDRKILRKLRYLLSAIQRLFFIDRTRGIDLVFYMGGNWFSITHDFAKYLLQRKEFIRKTFNHGFFNDEILMPTMLFNSPFKKKVSKKMNLRYVDWKRGNPYIWQEKDYEELTSKDLYFARKFSHENHPEIMEKLRRKLLSSDEKG